MDKYDKKVVDWVDRLVEKEHWKNYDKYGSEFGRVGALHRVNNRLTKIFTRLSPESMESNKSRAEFLMNAMCYSDDLDNLFKNAWDYKGCLSDRYRVYHATKDWNSKHSKTVLKQVNKKVVDWLDKIVREEQSKSVMKGETVAYGCIPSLNRVRERLNKAVEKMPKNTNVAKGTKAEFIISASIAANDLARHFKNEWHYGNCIKNKCNEFFNVKGES